MYWHQVERKYIHRFLPQDCFLTLAWVVLFVVIGIIIKCFFEFAQESLVGSVVNLSLFDLRNRFYRNAIHLDVDQFGEQGSSELMARFTNDMESLGAGIKTLFGKVVAEPLRALACVVHGLLHQLAVDADVPHSGADRGVHPGPRRPHHEAGDAATAGTHVEHLQDPARILPGHPRRQGVHDGAVRAAPFPHGDASDYYHKAMLVVNIDALADPIIEILGVAAVAAALLAGCHLVLQEATHLFGMRMTEQPLDAAESLLQLYVLLAAIADPVRKLSSVFTRIQSACAASDRIFDFVDRRPRVQSQ